MPPPTHMVTTTCLAPRRFPSSSACPTCREPVMPKGWPMEIAPPLTFILSWSMPSTSAHRNGTQANASLSSHRSMSATLRPCRSSSRGTATVGPMPISSGAHPATAKPLKAPRGVTPARCAAASDMSTQALAPSDNCDALPAVTVADGSCSARTGVSAASDCRVVLARLHSSLTTVYGTLDTSPVSLSLSIITVSIGTISSSNSPACCAAAVRCCDRREYSSCRAREMP
mmetsp:Transcript_36202/g.116255  ORF Transcript_36202/g.116255 Transcript_36202/m.116255 type:complete len:229 (+) Transcript_36202:478-1164(+)